MPKPGTLYSRRSTSFNAGEFLGKWTDEHEAAPADSIVPLVVNNARVVLNTLLPHELSVLRCRMSVAASPCCLGQLGPNQALPSVGRSPWAGLGLCRRSRSGWDAVAAGFVPTSIEAASSSLDPASHDAGRLWSLCSHRLEGSRPRAPINTARL